MADIGACIATDGAGGSGSASKSIKLIAVSNFTSGGFSFVELKLLDDAAG